MADREPLMGPADNEATPPDVELEDEEDIGNSLRELEHSLQGPGPFLWLLTFSAGISGLLFGYDTGVISATLVSIGTSLSSRQLTTLDKSLITASTSLFALLISPTAGLLADSFGRKRIILCTDILFLLGAIIQALSSSVWIMIIGRSIVGLAIGAASFVVPLYIAELAPAKFRGRLVTLNVVFVTLGQVVAYIIGWRFSKEEFHDGWKWMVGLGAIPAGVQGVVIIFMPESPRWLVRADKMVEATTVLQKVYGSKGKNKAIAPLVIKEIEHEIREEEDAKRGRLSSRSVGWLSSFTETFTELLYIPTNRRALTIACLLQGLQQLCGFNSLMYFSATIFSLLKFSSPTLTSLSVALANFLFTIISLLLIDRLGRRRMLLLSIPAMVISLLACASAFHFIRLPMDDIDKTAPENDSFTPALLIVVSLIIFTASYALGIGCVPWQQSELFALSVRSLGSGASTAVNWGSNFAIGISFLLMLEYLSPTWTFIVYAVICSIGWALIWLIYPETAGLSLEETSELLRDGWGVKASLEIRNERRRS